MAPDTEFVPAVTVMPAVNAPVAWLMLYTETVPGA